MFTKAMARLAGRAAVAGLLAAVAQLQASDGTSGTVIRSVAVAGLLAFAEAFTPLNPYVGFFKRYVNTEGDASK